SSKQLLLVILLSSCPLVLLSSCPPVLVLPSSCPRPRVLVLVSSSSRPRVLPSSCPRPPVLVSSRPRVLVLPSSCPPVLVSSRPRVLVLPSSCPPVLLSSRLVSSSSRPLVLPSRVLVLPSCCPPVLLSSSPPVCSLSIQPSPPHTHRVLLQCSLDLDSGDVDGWTALHAAAHWGQQEVCSLLADNMCDMAALNNVGQTPIEVADDTLVDTLEELTKKQNALRTEKAKLSQPPVIETSPSINMAPVRPRRTSISRMSSREKICLHEREKHPPPRPDQQPSRRRRGGGRTGPAWDAGTGPAWDAGTGPAWDAGTEPAWDAGDAGTGQGLQQLQFRRGG
uniref:Uncharacterized protein n=1 Tax=Salmo trutta TaxID=8032 RepID=A0A673ZX01_SALTR